MSGRFFAFVRMISTVSLWLLEFKHILCAWASPVVWRQICFVLWAFVNSEAGHSRTVRSCFTLQELKPMQFAEVFCVFHS